MSSSTIAPTVRLRNKFSGLGKVAGIGCLLVGLVIGPAYGQYGGGDGSAGSPYEIWNAAQMNAIGANQPDWGENFILMADIDLGAYTAEAFNLIGYSVLGPGDIPFTGVFDGNGHTISNFTYSTTSDALYDVALFVYVQGGEIKDLGMIDPCVLVDPPTGVSVAPLGGFLWRTDVSNCYVQGGSVTVYHTNSYASGLIASAYAGPGESSTISNCHNTSCIMIDPNNNAYVAGLVGTSGGGSVIMSNCYSTVDVAGGHAAGLVWSNSGMMSDCYATGVVSGNGTAGGLVNTNVAILGKDPDGVIINCYATGDVSAVSGFGAAGGLVRNNRGAIVNSYATGNVSASYDSGGLVGTDFAGVSGSSTYLGSISDCYATGDVTGLFIQPQRLGGLVGKNDGADISLCYATGDVAGDSKVGGLVGLNTAGTIANCYARGDVSAYGLDNAGLVGRNENGASISYCYSSGHVSPGHILNGIGGLVGSNSASSVTASFWDTDTSEHTDSSGGTGKTTAQMQEPNTYLTAGWDFVGEAVNGTADIWSICSGGCRGYYPKLTDPMQVALLLGDLIADPCAVDPNIPVVDLADVRCFIGDWLSSDYGGPYSAGPCGSDLSGDGSVDLEDYRIFSLNWQKELQ